MALFYSKGTISHMSEVTSGQSTSGRQWARMNIMIDVPGFQGSITKVCFQVGTDRIDDVTAFHVGDKVEIGWSIYAREYNGKWYNNVDLVNIKSQGTQNAQTAAPMQKATSAYEVCQNFCREKNCDFKLGTHLNCSRAVQASGFNPTLQTDAEPDDDMPF